MQTSPVQAGQRWPLNCSRSSRLANLPTLVLGSVSTKTTSLGQPPLGDPRRQVRRGSSPGVTAAPGLRHHAGQRALLPALVRQADHGGLEHVGMADDRVLQLDARDPLAAALDHVLGAIGDLHVAVRRRSSRRRRCGTSRRGTRRRSAGRRSTPAAIHGPAHLQLADALAVPRQRVPASSTTRISTPGSGVPCLARTARCAFGAPVVHVAARLRHRGQRRRLGHAPGLHDRDAELVVSARSGSRARPSRRTAPRAGSRGRTTPARAPAAGRAAPSARRR